MFLCCCRDSWSERICFCAEDEFEEVEVEADVAKVGGCCMGSSVVRSGYLAVYCLICLIEFI